MSSSSPTRLSLRQSVAMVWRTLRSMRTALILLLMLAAASVVGSLIPQIPNSPDRVAQYVDSHPLVGDLYRRAGLFDVFGSWWFTLITVLLFVSLVACLIPRTRAAWRALRARPIQAREIDAFRHYEEREVALPPAEAIEAARSTLRRRRFRVASDPERPALAAEKGALRETGSLLFHWAFILILVGVVYGKGTGFSGFALVVEGQTWIDAQANYDGQLRTGRFFDGEFTGVGVHLNEFESAFRETGQPMDFVSRVDLIAPDGTPIRSQDIRVNHPAKVDGITIYQSSFGWAPVIKIADGGQVLFDGAVPFSREEAPEGVPDFAMPWRGVVKLPTLRPQVAIDLELWPDSRAFFEQLQTGEPVAMLTAFAPVMRYTVYEGKLTDPSPVSLDVTFMKKTASGIVGAGREADLATGRLLKVGATSTGPTLAFTDLKQYSVLQVAKDRGVPIVLVAAILILVGLLPALYSSRRKVWVRAEPSDTGSRLLVGGFALQRKAQFEEEFDRLVTALEKAAGGAGSDDAEREKVGTR